MNRIRFALAGLVLPVMLHAQHVGANDSSTVTSFRFFAAHYGGWLVAAFDSIPESRYAYRPTPVQRSIANIAEHLEDANYGLCNRLGPMKHALGAKDRLADSIKERWPKDTLIARLRASLAFCDSAMARLSDARLEQHVSYGPPGSSLRALPSRTLVGFVTDLAEHYSQLASYMRILDLTPPSALGPAKPTAIALTPAELSRFVGTYDLAASSWQDSPRLVLDVTLAGDVLTLSPRGLPAARLWPSSPTEFFVREVDAQVTFTVGAGGTVTGLVIHQNGEHRVARKVK